jgi:hypothetical protein
MFDADFAGLPIYYGSVFDSAFFRALSLADPKGQCSSQLLRGDALVHTLCEKTTAVSRAKDRRGRVIISATRSHDKELYRTIVWDIVEATATQWNTVDDDLFPYLLGSHNVYCITLPTCPLAVREAVDARLRGVPAYCGSVEIDLGNPLQRLIFLEKLIAHVFIHRGLHPNFPPFISRIRRLFRPPGAVSFGPV